jgi:hypothetical protein
VSKLINSKASWSCIIAVLAIVFCVQLGMQFRGDPDEAVTRQLEQEIQQVTAQEHQLSDSIPLRDDGDQELATLHPGDSN